MAPTIINTAKPRPTPDGLRGDGPGLSAARLFGLLLAFAFVVAAIGSAADRMVATHPDWDRRVPSLFADNAWRYRAYAAMTSHDAAKAVAAARAAVRTGPIDPASSDLLGTALLTAPWPTLLAITALYLLLIPFSFASYARVRQRRATALGRGSAAGSERAGEA